MILRVRLAQGVKVEPPLGSNQLHLMGRHLKEALPATEVKAKVKSF